MGAQDSRVRILSVTQFHERFGTFEQCEAHLTRLRWPEGFVCPHCHGSRAAYLSRRRLHQCHDCRRQTSLTAGTIFHGSRLSLDKWFWAVYRLAQDKKGCSAMLLAKELDVSYPTAWLMGHKIRQAMNRHSPGVVLQGLVELDDAYLGGTREARRGRPGGGDERKPSILVAVEIQPDGKPGRAAIRPVRNFRKPTVNRFVQACLQPNCVVRTDQMKGFGDLARLGHAHQSASPGLDRKQRWKLLPKVHLLISNLKRFILGRHHTIHGKHAERYLGEFAYRFNRRRQESTLFATLIQTCVRTQVITYPELCMAERN